jgi:hypothetical protein
MEEGMTVYFTKKHTINIMAKRWAEASGLIIFFDKDDKPVASLAAFPGLVIEDGDGNQTVFRPQEGQR